MYSCMCNSYIRSCSGWCMRNFTACSIAEKAQERDSALCEPWSLPLLFYSHHQRRRLPAFALMPTFGDPENVHSTMTQVDELPASTYHIVLFPLMRKRRINVVACRDDDLSPITYRNVAFKLCNFFSTLWNDRGVLDPCLGRYICIFINTK